VVTKLLLLMKWENLNLTITGNRRTSCDVELETTFDNYRCLRITKHRCTLKTTWGMTVVRFQLEWWLIRLSMRKT